MSTPPENKEPLATPDAMNMALQAEHRALEAIKGCERDAARLIDTAQQQARTITERTNRRISRLHAHYARVTEAQIKVMLREGADAADQAIHPEAKAHTLEAAVDRVAARLTGNGE